MKRGPPCGRTAILVDFSSRLDAPCSRDSAPASPDPVAAAVSSRPRLSSIVSSVVEYSRILSDSSPSHSLVVFAAGAQLSRVGGHSDLVSGFADVRPGDFLDSRGIVDALSALAHSATSLPAPAVAAHRDEGDSSVSPRCRFICVLPHDPKAALCQHSSSVGLFDIPMKLDGIVQGSPHDLVIVKVADDRPPQHPSPSAVSEASFSAQLATFDELPRLMSELAAEHCCLRKVVVSGVPIRSRGTRDAGSQSEAELWSSAFPNHVLSASSSSPLLLHFRNSNGIAADALPCSCIHRVTSASTDSVASLCLLRAVAEGRGVLLSRSPSPADPLVSHTIQKHANGVLYLHCCTPLEVMRELPAADLGSCSKYRVRDFLELQDTSMLCMPDEEAALPLSTVQLGGGASVLSPVFVERNTRFFPWGWSETILFGSDQYEDLKRLADFLRKAIPSVALTKPALDVTIEIIGKLFACIQTCEPRMFPPLRSSGQARKDAYRKLWAEVYHFARACDTTPEHHAIVEFMERKWGEPLGLKNAPELAEPPKVVAEHQGPQPMDIVGNDATATEPQQTVQAVASTFSGRRTKQRQDLGRETSLLSVFWK